MTPNQARKEEREAIVEWLREGKNCGGEEEWFWREWFADAINRGDHWEGKDG